MKDTSLLWRTSPTGGATNSSGFSALPTGVYNASLGPSSNPFMFIGQDAVFWSSTVEQTYYPTLIGTWGPVLLYTTPKIELNAGLNYSVGRPVRCVRN